MHRAQCRVSGLREKLSGLGRILPLLSPTTLAVSRRAHRKHWGNVRGKLPKSTVSVQSYRGLRDELTPLEGFCGFSTGRTRETRQCPDIRCVRAFGFRRLSRQPGRDLDSREHPSRTSLLLQETQICKVCESMSLSEHHGHTNRPPTKCRPSKCLTSGFGAVRLISTAGMNLLPGPDSGGPDSIFQEDGASTEVTGRLVSSNARITAGNGSRMSPEKLKP